MTLDDVRALAESNLPLVYALARRFAHNRDESEEYCQQGCIGLMNAAARFDPSRGVAFSTYAVPYILGEMRRLSRMEEPVHIPRGDRELRMKVRRAMEELTQTLRREPTIPELSARVGTDGATLALLLEDITVTSWDADNAPPIPDTDDWLSRVELRDSFSRLSRRDALLLRLRYGAGWTQQRVAERFGMSQMSVSRWERAVKAKLHALLEENE